MKKASVVLGFVILSAVTLTGGAALAQGTAPAVSAGGGGAGAGIGVGVSQWVNGFTGAQVVFDQPRWHIEGSTAFTTSHNGNPNNPRVTDFDFGVAAWYHLALGASSDFSIGGGFAVLTQSGMGSRVSWLIEPGAEIRAFITSNVAVHALIAFPLIVGDDGTPVVGNNGQNTSFGFSGQVLAAFGFTFFFR